MRNIIHIFLADISRLKDNVIALIVIMGLSVVPCLYAWFNIAASWDPYGRTSELKVAVVNSDNGYDGKLIPVQLNIGETVTNELRKNTSMDWVFTTKGKALNGVRSGEYYAAIIIPGSFSDDMLSMFSTDVKFSNILYYVNQKRNAIAPKVTDKGASSIRQSVNENFLSTLVQVQLDLAKGMSKLTGEKNATRLVTNFRNNLLDIQTSLKSSETTITALSTMMGSLSDILSSTNEILEKSGDSFKQSKNRLKDIQGTSDDSEEAIRQAINAVGQTITQMDETYWALGNQADRIFDQMNQGSSNAQETLSDIKSRAETILNRYQNIRSNLQRLDDSIPSSMGAAHRLNNVILGNLDASIANQQQLIGDLEKASSAVSDSTASINRFRRTIRDDISDIRSSFQSMRTAYDNSWKKDMNRAWKSLSENSDSLKPIISTLGRIDKKTDALSEGTSHQLKSMTRQLRSSSKQLKDASDGISKVVRALNRVLKSGSLKELSRLTQNTSSEIGSFLAAPVELDKVSIYPVENYGSAMAPFYSTLAMWVGAVMLVALMDTVLAKSRRRLIPDLKAYQVYWGRLILFTIIGMIQALLVSLGDLYYLEIQCKHPFYFILAALITSIIYSNIMYTLTLSFGDVGKAICVVLMVLQVAGSGGTFPIQMTPRAFQIAYPFLPFVHSMQAMRECIGGFYGNTYWLALMKLSIWLLPMLFIGLVLRKPIIKLNQAIIDQLEKTQLM